MAIRDEEVGEVVEAVHEASRYNDKMNRSYAMDESSDDSNSLLADEFDEPVYDAELLSDDNDSDENEGVNDEEEEEEQKPPRTRKEKLFRKASVAAAGGGLVAAGVAMMVLPGPGIPTVAAGLHVLGKEFKTAKKAEDKLVDSTKKMGESIKKRTPPEVQKRASDAKKKVLETTDSVRSEIAKHRPEVQKRASDAKKKVLETTDSVRSEIAKSSRSLGKEVKKRTPKEVRKSVGSAKKQLLKTFDGVVGTKETVVSRRNSNKETTSRSTVPVSTE